MHAVYVFTSKIASAVDVALLSFTLCLQAGKLRAWGSGTIACCAFLELGDDDTWLTYGVMNGSLTLSSMKLTYSVSENIPPNFIMAYSSACS